MGSTKPHILDDASFTASSIGTDPLNWNWSSQASVGTPANYYEASLSLSPVRAPLAKDINTDVLVIGGGLLGASTALHLAEAGVDTVLVDRHAIGSGASGRNGGQLTPGLARWEAANLLQSFSADQAKRLWQFASTESMALIDEIAARYDLDFDRKHGHLTTAVHPAHMKPLQEDLEARRQLGDSRVRLIEQGELQQWIRSQLYHGALLDEIGGQLHPLALLRGLVYGFRKHDGAIFENTEVLDIQHTEQGVLVATSGGRITARKAVVIAVHTATSRFLPVNSATTLSLFTYIGVSAPLLHPIAELLPGDVPVYDTQFQIDYYRRVRRNRILLGSQGSGRTWSPERVRKALRKRFKAIFPELGEVQLDYIWSGQMDFTLNGAIDSRKLEYPAPVYLVHGWNGHGVAQSVRIGKAIADDFTGLNDDYALLTSIRHRPIPFARQLSPIAIEVAKVGASVMSTLCPGKLISF